MKGIYKITSPTDKVYIGQSRNMQNRIRVYSFLACKDQSKLYNSLKKHGWKAHTFEVIMELREDISQEWLNYWEQFFMDYYRGEGYELMNLKEAGHFGKLSQSSLNKISEKQRGVLHHSSKEVFQFSLDGKLIKRWGCIVYAANTTKIKASNISAVCKKRVKTAGNFLWAYTPTANVVELNKKGRRLLQFTREGDFVKEWCSAAAAARFYNTNSSSIIRCARGGRPTSYNFVWKYKETN